MVVTGSTNSRLSELRKYTVTTVFLNKYVGGGSYTIDGVDYVSSTNPTNNIIYYIGGIKYVDTLIGYSSGTTFSYTPVGTNSLDFINVPIFKNPNKDNIISEPKINDDVFIIRQELSAYDKNYRLEFMKNLVDVETYVGGKFFNIVTYT